jgi:hypothetical protein
MDKILDDSEVVEKSVQPTKKLIGKFKKIDDIDITRINNKKNNAEAIKATWADLYDDVYKYAMPHRGSAYKLKAKGQNGVAVPIDNKLYNTVGQNATIAFVNKIQQMLCPPDTDWIKLRAGKSFEMKYDEQEISEINLKLNDISNVLNNVKAISNFDIAISEFFFDLVAGTACLLIQAGNKAKPIIFKCIPFRDYSISEGSDGSVNAIYRNFNINYNEIDYYWDDVDKKQLEKLKKEFHESEKDEVVIDLVEATYYNYKSKKWDYVVYNEALHIVIVSRQYDNNPFVVLRWNKSSDDWYGTGVGLVARNDLVVYNEIMKDMMTALAYSLPSFLADASDPLRKNFVPKPLAVNYVKYENGKPLVTPLQYDGHLDWQKSNLMELQMGINKTMLAGQIPTTSKEMTAHEVQQVINEESINYISVFGRLIQDFLTAIPKVMLETLQKAFDVLQEIDVNAIDGYYYKIQIDTPFSKNIKGMENQSILNSIMLLMQMDPTGGLLKRTVKLDKMLIDVLRNNGIDENVLNSMQEIATNEQMQMQAAQQQQQQQMAMQLEAQGVAESQKAQAQVQAQQPTYSY